MKQCSETVLTISTCISHMNVTVWLCLGGGVKIFLVWVDVCVHARVYSLLVENL